MQRYSIITTASSLNSWNFISRLAFFHYPWHSQWLQCSQSYIYTSATESNVSFPHGSSAMPSQEVAELNIQIWNSPIERGTAGLMVLSRPQGPIAEAVLKWLLIVLLSHSGIKVLERRPTEQWESLHNLSGHSYSAPYFYRIMSWEVLQASANLHYQSVRQVGNSIFPN